MAPELALLWGHGVGSAHRGYSKGLADSASMLVDREQTTARPPNSHRRLAAPFAVSQTCFMCCRWSAALIWPDPPGCTAYLLDSVSCTQRGSGRQLSVWLACRSDLVHRACRQEELCQPPRVSALRRLSLCCCVLLISKCAIYVYKAMAQPMRTCMPAALASPPSQRQLADRTAACPGPGPLSDNQPILTSSAHASALRDPSALDQLSRRHSPGNVLHEFARGGVLASLPAMIAETGEGDGAPGERPAAPGAAYSGPMGSGREVLLQVRSSHAWYLRLGGRSGLRSWPAGVTEEGEWLGQR